MVDLQQGPHARSVGVTGAPCNWTKVHRLREGFGCFRQTRNVSFRVCPSPTSSCVSDQPVPTVYRLRDDTTTYPHWSGSTCSLDLPVLLLPGPASSSLLPSPRSPLRRLHLSRLAQLMLPVRLSNQLRQTMSFPCCTLPALGDRVRRRLRREKAHC